MTIQKEHFVPMELSDWQTSVKDKDLTTAPESPSNNDRYIIAGTGGGWSAGTINDIVCYVDSEWLFVSPLEGMQVYVLDEHSYYFYNGSSWAIIGGSGDMTKAVYDTNSNNIVDKAEAIDDNNGNEINANELVKNIYNTVLLAFKLAAQGSLTIFNMIDGFIDEFEDESGIDTVNSINETYDSTNDYYSPTLSDSNCKLLLHLDGEDEATSTTDESPSEHVITFNGEAQLDTDYKKFGTSSLYCSNAGNIDYLSIPDSADWDFAGSCSECWTISFFVKFDSGSGNDTYMIKQYENSLNHQALRFVSTLGWRYFVKDNNIDVIDTGYGGNISDTDWHHVTLCKVLDEYAVYLDGVQVNYTQDTSTKTLNAELQIGHYSNAHIDDVFITKENYFSASPNSGKTDTITVPTKEISLYGNMTLISDSQSAESEPNKARIVILEEDVGAITLNTDINVYISKDNGATWAEVTLEDEGDYDSTKRILIASVDLSVSGIGSGTDIEYKIITNTEKNLKIHAVAVFWD